MADVFKWVDELPGSPPPDAHRTAIWGERLAPLAEQPQRWARVYGPIAQKNANSTAHQLQLGYRKGYDPSVYEFTFRGSEENGEYYIFARYIGSARD